MSGSCGCAALRNLQRPEEVDSKVDAPNLSAYPAPAFPSTNESFMSRNLVILDLNGTLLLRAKGNRKVWARPYFESFLSYLVHPSVSTPNQGLSSSSKAGLDFMIWSSAQPHSVGFMVESIFGKHARHLVAVWDRTNFGLSKQQYNAKYPTIKDLNRVWKALPQHSSNTTVLLDDSVDKAQRQPDNHICLVDYSSKVRAQDLKLHRDSVRAVTSASNLVEPAFDSLLLAIVGILEVMRGKNDVAAWLHAGGLSKAQREDSTSEDSLAALLSGVTLDNESTSKPSGLWFEDPKVLEYWINKGKATLKDLQIPIRHGITV